MKMALPGQIHRDILLDEVRLTEIFGKRWREYEEEGFLWARVEERLGVQVVH